MSVSAIAQNYAETLLLLAAQEGEEERYGELLGEISAVYRDVEDFRRFLDTPGVSQDDKERVLREALSGFAPEMFIRFLLVVLDKRRQRWLPAMDAAYRDLLDNRAGRLHATIRLSFEPDEAPRAELVEALSEHFGAVVVPHFLEDDRILGGIVVRVGDRVMDGSLRRRLDDLRLTLTRSGFEASTL